MVFIVILSLKEEEVLRALSQYRVTQPLEKGWVDEDVMGGCGKFRHRYILDRTR